MRSISDSSRNLFENSTICYKHHYIVKRFIAKLLKRPAAIEKRINLEQLHTQLVCVCVWVCVCLGICDWDVLLGPDIALHVPWISFLFISFLCTLCLIYLVFLCVVIETVAYF